MFLCYGQEEFFECKDENYSVALSFTDMLEQRNRQQVHQENKAIRKNTGAAQAISRLRSGEDLVGVDSLEFRAEQENRLSDDVVQDMDQSSFAGGLGETRMGESRIDDEAFAYEATLTPDALMAMRKTRRQVRELQKKDQPADLILQSIYSTALATPVKEGDDSPGQRPTQHAQTRGRIGG